MPSKRSREHKLKRAIAQGKAKGKREQGVQAQPLFANVSTQTLVSWGFVEWTLRLQRLCKLFVYTFGVMVMILIYGLLNAVAQSH